MDHPLVFSAESTAASKKGNLESVIGRKENLFAAFSHQIQLDSQLAV